MECFVVTCAFQSTPSAWRETHLPTYTYKILQNFNPLPPHGGRLHSITIICISRYYFNPLPPHGGRLPFTRGYADISLYFNPLPPHGGRRKFRKVCSWKKRFQSTPSAWRETLTFFVYKDLLYISIHSLRMEGDRKGKCSSVPMTYFNPLPPHGGRPLPLSSLSVCIKISIHSLRMEGDIQP